ncbi:MAG TPA: hypothetical protein PK481_03775, partial [Bacillota bacterium]|nr:hypothetical protein [Bacillota bacterium]
YGFSNFQKVQILKKDQIVTSVSIKEGQEKINLLAAEDFSMVLSESEKENITTEIKTGDGLREPIEKDEVLGEIIVYAEGNEVKKIELLSSVSVEAVKKPSLWWLWAIAGFLLYRTVVTIYKVRRRKKYRNVTYIKR